MQYDLSPNDRFFLNQLIPKWDSGKPFDLEADMKYVFHREKGTNYNPAQFEYTLKTIEAFLTDHGFAKENPAKKYTFTLLPKGNMLIVKRTIEQFEFYQDDARATGNTVKIPPAVTHDRQARSDVYIPAQPRSGGGSFLRLLLILAIILGLGYIAWYFINNNS